jgi:hypothetical protein
MKIKDQNDEDEGVQSSMNGKIPIVLHAISWEEIAPKHDEHEWPWFLGCVCSLR